MEIKGILVTALAPFENHIANGGEKLLGNASSIKRRPDGRVYVSGQMQRHVLFSAINRINTTDPDKRDTFVSNGDGISNLIEKDLRADMGGFMHPSKGDYSGRRTAPLSVTPAVAVSVSDIGRDLLVRIRCDKSDDAKDQALATKEFSEYDLMHMNFFLDISGLSVSKAFEYKKSFNLGTKYFKHANDNERKRRARLYLEATKSMNDYASQARNAVSGEPQKVLIVFDTILSRKASRYFVAGEQEQKNIIKELEAREAKYFLGDDTKEDSVHKAYTEALEYLSSNTLYDPAKGTEVVTFEQAFGGE
ncbi:MAG: type I-PGING CRISPR-associated protein Cas7/Csp1 [Bacteroidetes bacterium GWF2_41_31]|nr:MAG: type I-PGING CRISPR-associated protein Cas7/Csp1 [Bacteroidetes bacterium GWF2_41_31]